MMSHTQPPEVLAKQARIMVDAGCQCVYVVDSAGALIMEQTADRVSALVAEIGHEATVGFHGHENLGLGVANTVIAARAGATQIDGSVRRFGAGAGNTPLEAFIGVCDKLGWTTGVDFLKIVDASEDVIKPAMPEECQLDRMTLMMGYAGVYSSFLKHAGNAAERYGVSGAKILLEAGRRKLIGGQEDQLIDIALMLKAEQDKASCRRRRGRRRVGLTVRRRRRHWRRAAGRSPVRCPARSGSAVPTTLADRASGRASATSGQRRGRAWHLCSARPETDRPLDRT